MKLLGGRRPMRPCVLPFLLVAFVASGRLCHAQVLYGSIVGTVTDPSQAAVPGGSVILVNIATNLARETTTRADGSYGFVNVQPGSYRLRVVCMGFKEFVKDAVPVATGTVTRVDLTLEVGSVTETVTVESTATLLQTDTGDVHSEFRSQEIVSLPLGNYRNYQTVVNLVPGAAPGILMNSSTDAPARALSTNINGTARNNNNTRLDGATDVYIWLPHQAAYVAPAETVDTVNVTTASFDAEQGMAGGAAMTVLTRTGTNELHGSGFWLHEDERLRARNWANVGDCPYPDGPGCKPDTSRNIGGVTLGGPLIRNKLFFFGSWEGHYTTSPSTYTSTVPTEAMRAGDFSAFGTTIYDPATGNADGSARTPFPDNVVPADRTSPIAQQLQARLPLPNGPGVAGNYTKTGTQEFDRNNYDLKLSYNAGSAAQVFAKFSQMNAKVSSDMWLGNPQDGGAGGAGFGFGVGTGDTRVRIGTVGATWTLSPRLVVDATLGLMRFDQTCLGQDYGTNYGTDVFGIPGTNGEGGANGDIRYSGMPWFQVAGFEDFGGVGGWTPIFRNDRSYNVSANATYSLSSHELRFGLDVVRLELTHWQPELGYGPRGFFYFDGSVTTPAPDGSPNPFNSYAAFLLGLPAYLSKSLQYETMTGREWQYAGYVRDRWQATRNLTLNLGLRYELYPMMTRANRGIEYYDETNNTVRLGGVGGNPRTFGIQVRYPHLLPRVGFSYRMGESNVVRGGYGITVSPLPLSRPLRGFYPLTITNEFWAANPYLPAGSLATGIPLFYGPDESSGVVPLPDNADMRSPYYDHLNRGYIQSWNLTYERRLPWDMSLSLGYVGTASTHLIGYYNINSSGPGQGWRGAPLFQAFERTAGTYRLDGWQSGNYHSLQVALNKPFSRGFFVKGAYTYSKAMNCQNDDGWDGVDWNYPALMYKNYGPAGYDRTHVFQLGFVADLPFAKNAKSALGAIVKGWSLNGIVSAFSGIPLTVYANGASLNAKGNYQYADLVGTPRKLGGIGADSPYYDPSAWAPVTEARPGTSSRNSVRGPGWWNIDLSLFRRFPIGPRFTLEGRVEAFNLTNTPHFGLPDTNVSDPGFMTITRTSDNAPERQVRLGIRLQF